MFVNIAVMLVIAIFARNIRLCHKVASLAFFETEFVIFLFLKKGQMQFF